MKYLWKFIKRFFKRKIHNGGQIAIDINCDTSQARKEFEKLTYAVNKLNAAMSNLESQTDDTRYSLEHMNEEFEKHNQKK